MDRFLEMDVPRMTAERPRNESDGARTRNFSALALAPVGLDDEKRSLILQAVTSDPQLQQLIDTWPKLSAALRAGVLAFVRTGASLPDGVISGTSGPGVTSSTEPKDRGAQHESGATGAPGGGDGHRRVHVERSRAKRKGQAS